MNRKPPAQKRVRKAVGHEPGPGKPRTEVASTELAREINRDLALDLIRERQPIARVDLARISGLQNSTVSAIVEQLLAEGWISEGPVLKTGRGRRPAQIRLNPRIALLVASIHPREALLGLADLNGEITEPTRLELPARPAAAVHHIAQGMKSLREQFRLRDLRGVGVSIFGHAGSPQPASPQPASPQPASSPRHPWEQAGLQRELADTLGTDVELESRANATLLGELWFGGLPGVQDAVLLEVSGGPDLHGMAAGLLSGGRLLRGRSGMAGDVAHLPMFPSGALSATGAHSASEPLAASSPVCTCGRHGCWQTIASCQAAVRNFEQRRPEMNLLGYSALARLALEGNPAARQAIEAQAVALGKGLRTLTAGLSPEVILFAGEVVQAWPLLQPTLERICRETMLHGPAPRLAAVPMDLQHQLRGPAAMVLQRHTSYYHSRSTSVHLRRSVPETSPPREEC